MAGLAAFLLLAVLLWGFGEVLAARLGLAGERLGFPIALSYGFLTLAVFALAWGRFLSIGSLLALLGVMGLLAVRRLAAAARAGTVAVRTGGWKHLVPPRGLDRWLAAGTVMFYGLALVMAMAPPTGMDAGVYHFTIPKLIVREHGLVPLDDVWIHKFGGFYMLYALGMATGGEVTAKLFAWGASVAAGALACSVARRLRPGAGWAAAFILASSPLAVGYAGYENLEIPLLLYLTASVYALHRMAAGDGSRWAVAACAFAGFAVSTKPSSFPAAVVLPVAFFLVRRWAVAMAGMGAFLATAGFWGLWNAATTGSFIYRYPGSALEGGAGIEPSLATTLLGPLRTLGFVATAGTYWPDSAGPFVVAGLAGFIVFRWREEARWPAVLCLLGVAGYIGILAILSPGHLSTSFSGRYLAPIVVGFGAVPAALFADWARTQVGLLRWAILLALLLPAVPLAVLKAGKAAVAAPAALGIERREAYLAKKIETFQACRYLDRLPDPRVKVLFVAHRPYYLDRPFVHAVDSGWQPFYRGLRDREDFVRRAREQGITHVLYEPSLPQGSWIADPDVFFGSAPFREAGRWPYWLGRTVRVYELMAP